MWFVPVTRRPWKSLSSFLRKCQASRTDSSLNYEPSAAVEGTPELRSIFCAFALMTCCVSYLICRRPSLKVRDLYLMISKMFNLSSTSPWASVLFISLLFWVWEGSVGSTLLLASIQWIICLVTSIIQSYLIACKHTTSLQFCPALCDPVDSSPPVFWSM